MNKVKSRPTNHDDLHEREAKSKIKKKKVQKEEQPDTFSSEDKFNLI